MLQHVRLDMKTNEYREDYKHETCRRLKGREKYLKVETLTW